MVPKGLLGAILTVLLSAAHLEAETWTVDATNRAVVNGNLCSYALRNDALFDCDFFPECHIATRDFDSYSFNLYLHFMFGSNENALMQLPYLPSFMYGMATGNHRER